MTRRRGDAATRRCEGRACHGVAKGEAGFTLIEMIVVVAIIALLLAIAVPVSTGVLRSSEAKATQITLETVKNAIEVFQSEKPLRFHPAVFHSGSAYSLFGPLPPSPTAALSDAVTVPALLQVSGPEGNPKQTAGAVQDLRTARKFTDPDMMIEAYLQGEYGFIGAASNQAAKYPTSECLLLFLRQFSPQARTIVDRLGKSLTNEDKDFVQLLDPVGKPYTPPRSVELFELRDGWGNPVRYTVRYIGSVVGGKLYRWELRSAGADGVFADVLGANAIPDPFSAAAADNTGDDVIVSGSVKVEN